MYLLEPVRAAEHVLEGRAARLVLVLCHGFPAPPPHVRPVELPQREGEEGAALGRAEEVGVEGKVRLEGGGEGCAPARAHERRRGREGVPLQLAEGGGAHLSVVLSERRASTTEMSDWAVSVSGGNLPASTPLHPIQGGPDRQHSGR